MVRVVSTVDNLDGTSTVTIETDARNRAAVVMYNNLLQHDAHPGMLEVAGRQADERARVIGRPSANFGEG